jgi:RES domain-containing protein
MEVFRISNVKHSHNLYASGRASRWNRTGEYVVYASTSRSLSTLELLVRAEILNPDARYQVMVLSLADEENLTETVRTKDLPSNWRLHAAYTQLQAIGSNWYRSRSSLLLKVPSAIIPMEFNYVMNTGHPDFKAKVRLVRREDYFWDGRLFSKRT